jgi:hypothetical protein
MLLEELHEATSSIVSPTGRATMENFDLSQRAKIHYQSIWEIEQKKLLMRIHTIEAHLDQFESKKTLLSTEPITQKGSDLIKTTNEEDEPEPTAETVRSIEGN